MFGHRCRVEAQLLGQDRLGHEALDGLHRRQVEEVEADADGARLHGSQRGAAAPEICS